MKVAAIVLILAFSACVPCVAGTTGVMNGYVRDENGKPVADALVTVTSPSQTAQTHTDKGGFFVFVTLPPDVYTVEAETAGTSGAYAMGARINSDQTTFLNLSVGGRLCGPTITLVTVAAYKGSDQFLSLDVQRMEQYPPNVAPLILLPMAPPPQHFYCL